MALVSAFSPRAEAQGFVHSLMNPKSFAISGGGMKYIVFRSGVTLFLCFSLIQLRRLWGGELGSYDSSSSGSTSGAGNVRECWSSSSLEIFTFLIVPDGVVAAVSAAKQGCSYFTVDALREGEKVS